MVRKEQTCKRSIICKNLYSFTRSLVFKRLIFIVLIGFFCHQQAKADHFWYVNSLSLIEDPANSGMYRIDYTFTVNFQTVKRFYWEVYVVESGCNATDGFSESFSGCTLQGNLADGNYTGTLASGILLCPGKTYDAIMFTRRRGDCLSDNTRGSGGSNVPNCGAGCGDNSCGCPEDRASAATPLGLLTKFPSVAAGDPATIWAGAPLNSLGDTPTFDGNWAYVRTTLTGTGLPDYDFSVDIDLDNCFDNFDESASFDETDGQVVTENFGGAVAQIRCGTPLNVEYNAINSCGAGFPGNTFEVIDNSTIGGVSIGSNNSNIPMGPDVNVDGRFEELIGQIAIGNVCQSGQINLNMINATCSAETETDVTIIYDIEVLYPTSNFATPTRVNCSDACGQDLILSGGPQWNSTGLNMGTSTTLPVTNDSGILNFDWTGQVCSPSVSAVDCDEGSGSVTVDNCASCGVYDITYAITNDKCSDCNTTTTKQIEIVSPVITNESADIVECDAIMPTMTFDVVECNPTSGAATTVPYTGSGEKMWERSDDPGNLLPFNAPGTVAPGMTVIFTPHWVFPGCASCNAEGSPITVTSLGQLEVTCPSTTLIGEYDCSNLATIPALPTTQATAEAAPYNIVIGSDPCGTIVVTSSDDDTPDACTSTTQVITRTITILDDQNNNGVQDGSESQIECDYTYNILAAFMPPALVSPPGDESISCDTPPTTTILNYTNNGLNACLSEGSVESTLTAYPGICGGTVTETWTIPSAENCSNGDIITSRVITILPPGPPVVTCPANATVACAADIVIGTPTVSTSCGATFSITNTPPTLMSGTADCPGAIYHVVYTVTDECMNSVNCTQVFTIANAAPTIVAPMDETVECLSDIMTGTPMTTTSCLLGETITSVGPTLASGMANCDGATYTIVYTIEDACGRMASATQTFTLSNNGPVITCPADATIECLADIVIGTATVVTDCGLGNSVTTSGPTLTSGTADCPGATYEIVYTATDDCGRMASCTQTFTIANAIPTVTAPADATVECFADIAAGTATGTTSCTLGSTITNSAPVLTSGQADCDGATYEITYTIADACGRMATDKQVFTLSNDPPLISIPSDAVVECLADISIGTAMTSSSCGLGDIVTTEGPTLVAGQADCPGASYSIKYTVTDDCNRVTSDTQFFTIANDPPTITCPADATVTCAANIVIGTPTVVTSCALGHTISTVGPTLISGDADCDGSIYSVVYTAEDDCGRMVSCTQTFTISNPGPTISTLAPMTVTCLLDITPSTPVTSASCTLGLTAVSTVGPTLTSGMANCDMATYEIVYTVMDDCMRSASSTQVFTLDNNPPAITSMPADQTVICQADIMANIAAVVYSTDCGLTASVTAGPVTPNAANSACGELDGDTYTITYTVEDECGRKTTDIQTFSINSSDPNITCAPDIFVVGCDASAAPVPDPSLIFGSDGCGMVTVSFIGDSPAGTVCPGDTLVISRTYRVTNACGVASDCVQLIKIYDDIAPSITTDAGALTVGCNEEPPLPTITVSDNCTAVGDITVDFRSDTLAMTCPGDLMIVRTWIATDQCGNKDSIKQEIGVFDEANPTFLSAPSDTTVSCVDMVPASMAPVFDASCGLSEVTMSESTTPGTCPGEMIVMRTWAAEDSCMRMVSFTQTITVSDTVKPTITCPADLFIVGCGLAALPAATPGSIVAADGCSTVTVTHEGDTQIGGGCIGDTLVVSRRYRATDECGNFTECIQKIRIVDNVAPIITSCPDDVIIVGCSAADAPAINPSLLVATDNCSTPTFSHVSDTPLGTVCVGDTLVITRIYRATDDCGNFTDCTQIIKIVDDVAPVITSCPSPINVKCFADIPLPMPGDVIATDNCGVANPATTLSTVNNGGSGCPGDPYTVTYTYQVTDNCNNVTTCTQVITVIDDSDPVITGGPVDQTIECIEALPDPDPTAIVAMDNCGIEVVTVIDTMNTSAPDCSVNPYQVIYTYQVVDSCGNSDTYQQTITVEDLTPPVLSATPDMITVSCISDVPGAQGITATDNCTGVMPVMFSQTAAGTCSGNDMITNTWTVTDCVGNVTTHEQLVIVDDNVLPVFSAEPADITVTCISEVPGDPGVTASDNCGETLTVMFVQSASGACPGDDTITNTWTTEDCAGNVKTYVQTITIVDNTAPTLSALPENITVECRSDVPGDPGITATDNCGEVLTVMYSQSAPGVCVGDDTITNTWTVTDCAGNETTHIQTVTIEDTMLPVLSAQPSDVTVECFSQVPGNPNITATDNCGEILVVSYVQSAAPSCVGAGTVTNTWTVSDCAGNSTIYTQTVTINDVTPPSFNAQPADITVNCLADVPGDPGITATDNCGESLTVSYIQSAAPACSGAGQVTNTWTVTDCAGLETKYIQTVTIDDNSKPILSAMPSDVIVTCISDIPGDPGITATDNCGESLTVTYNQSTIGACPGDDSVTNTWTVSDCAGNVTTHVQNVIVDDNTKPILSSMPADITVECYSAVPGDPGVTATDNCGESLIVTFVQSMPGACSGEDSITNTWMVEDCAGNITTHVQTITIDDNTDPILSATPTDITVECFSQVPGAQGVTATDNCGEALVVQFSQSLQGACVGVGVITNTWTVEDCAGNKSEHKQVVTLDDKTPPVLSEMPGPVTVECFADVPGDPGVTATDNCGELLTVMFVQSVAGMCEGNDMITNTWTVMDCAGNPTTHVQNITILDTTDPIAPADEGSVVTCLSDAVIPGTPIDIVDNCGATISPTGPVAGPDPMCVGTGTKTYTWTYTDCNGNVDTYTYTYTIVDDTSPVLDVTPMDITINCEDAIPVAPAVNGIDACEGILPAQMTEVIDGDMDACPFDYTITRTWSVADCAGNPVSYTQVITVQDIEDPVITCPADVVIIGCNRSFAPAVDITSVVATDNCGTPTVTHIGDSFSGGACIGDTLVIERTYRATDVCGRFTDCIQVIKIVDDVPPVVSGVSDLVVDCNADVDGLFANWVATHGGGTATDNCDIFSWSTIPANPVVTSMTGETCVTFVATDKCGNATSTEACFNINCSSIIKTYVDNLDMDGSGDVSVGDSLLYSIVYSNEGSTELTNVVVSDDLIMPSIKICPTLAPGADCILTGYHEVVSSDVAAGSIMNVASGESNETDKINDDVTIGVPTPSISLQKNQPTISDDKDGSGDMSVGDEIEYVIIATNNGSAALTNVTITDNRTTPMSKVCDIVPPLAQCTLVGKYIIKIEDLANGFVENEASVISDQTDPVEDDVTINLPSPLIEIVKGQPVNSDQDGSGDISLGDILTYTITVFNTGEATLTNVVITDNTITKVGGSEPCASVPPMGTCTFIGEYQIQASDISGTTINELTNIASANSDQTGTVVDSTTIMIPNPSMEINKFPAALTGDNDLSEDISVNDELSYRIVLTNNGNANLQSVTINDPTLTPSIKNCGDLMMGESCELIGTHIVLPSDLTNGFYENTVTGLSTSPLVMVTDTTKVLIPQPSHSMSKSTPVILEDKDGSNDPSAGDILGYSIVVTNTGTANLSNVVINDNRIIPSSITCDLLEPGEVCELSGTYEVKISDLGTTLNNKATSNTNQTDMQMDEADIIVPLPMLELEKTEGVLFADLDGNNLRSTGDTLLYTITATNTGTANLTNVTILDDLIDPDTKTCEFLMPGETCQLVGKYVIDQGDMDVGQLVNTASVDADQPSIDDQTVTTILPFVPELSLEKSVASISTAEGISTDLIDPGDVITYNYVVTNTGLVTMRDIAINDAGPSFGGLPGTNSLSIITCDNLVLFPNEVSNCSATYVISEADFDNALGQENGIFNIANTTGKDPRGEVFTSENDIAIDSIPDVPMVEIIKSAGDIADINGDGILWVDDEVIYSFTITNTGNSRLENLVVTDNNITNPIICNGTALDPGESFTCTASYILTEADGEEGQVVNTASVTGVSPTGKIASDISDDPSDPTTSTSDPTIVKIPCPSIACRAQINLALDANDPFKVTPAVVGLPRGFIVELSDGSGMPIKDNIIDCSYAGKTITYKIFHPCRDTPCWGNLNIETKGLPDLSTSYQVVTCGSNYSFLVSEEDLIDSIHADGCYAPLTEVNSLFTTSGDACDSTITIRSVVANATLDGSKSEVVLSRDTIVEKPIDLDEVICPDSDEFVNRLNIVCRQFNKFDNDLSPLNVYKMTRQVNKAYPYIDTGEEEEFFDTTKVIQSINNRLIKDTTVVLNGIHTVLDVVVHDTTFAERIVRGSRKIFTPLVPGGTCNLSVKYDDVVFDGCLGPETKTIRTWTILNWCTGEVKTCVQWLIIIDDTPPTIEEPIEDVTVSIDPWSCTANYNLPEPIGPEDDCVSFEYRWLSEKGTIEDEVISNLTVYDSPALFILEVEDNCGNILHDSSYIYIVDGSAPVAIAADEFNVSLSKDPETLEGVAKVYVEDVDQESHDAGCGDVSTCLLKEEELNNPIIRNGVHLTNEDGYLMYVPAQCSVDGVFVYESKPDKQTVFEEIPYVICKDFVKFCCSDVGPQKVALVVSDGSVYSQDGISWTIVTVEDKSQGVIQCEDVTVQCGDDYRPEVIGYPTVYDPICSKGELTYVDEGDVSNCGAGVIKRTWSYGGVVECIQRIKVESESTFDPYTIKWPKHYTSEEIPGVRRECELWKDNEGDPVLIDGVEQYRIVEYDEDVVMGESFFCTSDIDFGAPTWCAESCELIVANFETLEVEASDACKKIIRKWTVIDWCTWEENSANLDDDNDTSIDQFQAVDDEWLDAEDSDKAGLWHSSYHEALEPTVYNYPDNGRITKLECDHCEKSNHPADHVYFRYSQVDEDGYYTFDQVIKVIDETEPVIKVEGTVAIEIFDGAGSKDEGYANCIERAQVIASASDFCNGDLLDDDRLVWTVYILDELGQTVDGPLSGYGDSMTVSTGYSSLSEDLIIVWTVSDGCGNSARETSRVTFVDAKKPTPVCIQDLTTSTMNSNGSAVIWAEDYDRGSFDNCGPVDVMFKNEDGEFTRSLALNCSDLANGASHVFTLELYAVDEAGNYDFCNVTLRVDDNIDVCPDISNSAVASISGSIYTSEGDMVEGVQVSDGIGSLYKTKSDGQYAFANLPMYQDYNVSGSKNDDLTSGLTSADLVLIQQHILGQRKLDSPYKIIAADVNNDERISALDLIELRRVILGLSDEFANNESWRFIDAKQTFENPQKPWPLLEEISINFLSEDMSDESLIGIKVGDVNGSVVANSTLLSGGRSDNRKVFTTIDQDFEEGDIIKVMITKMGNIDISAFQFTLELDGLELVSMTSDVGLSIDDIGKHGKDRLTLVGFDLPFVSDEDVLELSFKANEPGRLRDHLRMSSSITSAKVYDRELKEHELSLSVEEKESLIANAYLLQNEPNPFKDETSIGFYLPEGSSAELSFYDAAGRLLYQVKDYFNEGVNSVVVSAEDLQATGVVYYQLIVEDTHLQKRMIILD